MSDLRNASGHDGRNSWHEEGSSRENISVQFYKHRTPYTSFRTLCPENRSVSTTRCLIFRVVMRTEGTESRDHTFLLKYFPLFKKKKQKNDLQCQSLWKYLVLVPSLWIETCLDRELIDSIINMSLQFQKLTYSIALILKELKNLEEFAFLPREFSDLLWIRTASKFKNSNIK